MRGRRGEEGGAGGGLADEGAHARVAGHKVGEHCVQVRAPAARRTHRRRGIGDGALGTGSPAVGPRTRWGTGAGPLGMGAGAGAGGGAGLAASPLQRRPVASARRNGLVDKPPPL